MTLIAIVLKQRTNPVFKELNAFFRKFGLVLLGGLIRLGNLNSHGPSFDPPMQKIIFPGILLKNFSPSMFDLFRSFEKDQALGRQLGTNTMSVL